MWLVSVARKPPGPGEAFDRMSRARRHVIILTAFTALLVFILSTFRIAVVHGDSMLPSYQNGQMVVVNRLTGLGGLHRGDVVLVRKGSDVLIKRIYRLPGETIDRHASVPFTFVDEYFEKTDDPAAPLRVPRGQIVVLGDNSAVSDDSREFGPVDMKDVLGTVLNAPPLARK